VNPANAYLWLELAQLGVAGVGLVVAVLEWSSVMALWGVGQTAAQRTLARQAAFVEVLRAVVHVVILSTAVISLILPSPPETMPHWMVELVAWRKGGLLLVALIATAGTLSARITRLRVAAQLRGQAAQEA
jgi:hypothetical protein